MTYFKDLSLDDKIKISKNEKLRLLVKTKEIYLKQYTKCLLNYQPDLALYGGGEPMGLCSCFVKACEDCGIYYVSKDYIIPIEGIWGIIPEWHSGFAYRVTPLITTAEEKHDLDYGYWYPIWDKASRINFLNWLISIYTV